MLDCAVTAVISACIKKFIKIGEFFVAILILKMEENIHFGMVCFIISKKVKTQLKCNKKISTVYREGAATDRTCQKWFVKFRAGDFSPDDVPQLGRPVEVDSDQIKTLTENN